MSSRSRPAILTPFVTFDLGSHSTRAGGGALSQTVIHGAAATPPTLNVSLGWTFTGWNLAFTSVTTDLVVTAQYSPTAVAFADWATNNGLASAEAAPSADPDGDSVPNLLEYLFGTSPSLSSSASVPTLARGSIDGQPALLFTHRRAKNSLATVVYQSTSDLANPASWATVAPVSTIVDSDVDHDDLVELVTVSIPLPATTPGLFVRIQVTQ